MSQAAIPCAPYLCDTATGNCLTYCLDAGTVCSDPDAGIAPFCADLDSDPLNCGACFATVPPPFDGCHIGRPSCDIFSGEQLCASPDASVCTNINHGDPHHCGDCFTVAANCDIWNGANSECFSSSCQCSADVIDGGVGTPDGGPAAYCVASVGQGLCSCNASQTCAAEASALSWGHDIFPLFQTGDGGATSASQLGCTASGCHTGGIALAAGHLDLSDLDAGYTGLVTGPIFSGKTCLTPPSPATTGAFNCPCVAQVVPGSAATWSSVLLSILASASYPQQCNTQLQHQDLTNVKLVYSPCAQLIVADWIDGGALP